MGYTSVIDGQKDNIVIASNSVLEIRSQSIVRSQSQYDKKQGAGDFSTEAFIDSAEISLKGRKRPLSIINRHKKWNFSFILKSR